MSRKPGRPRRFPNGLKTLMIQLPPEVIEAFQAKGGREWLFTELGFDFGPPAKTYTAEAKRAKDRSRSTWAILQRAMSDRPPSITEQ